ncbi:cyclin T [Nesidiocoris tenuis]|uniref:Cyclin T n=1 Tax=Nesidiocoris tenuis TaxID=355587 RepID=A0ABN7B033_9HEMI|nr:cyclin T [Nesidiocoris tenuis]
MAAEEKWYFTKEQLAGTPSRKCGYDADKELSCRQQAANFIQDMGQRLQVTQLCINTAIVYMHRFYMFHSFTRFHRNHIAAAALFLAAKVEEQPRKLEHVIKVSQICLHRDVPPPDVKSEAYIEHAQELVVNENILLQTLGFDVAIDHPHTHVVRCCQLVRASKDLAQTSYFMASNSLHLTTMCLQYKPTVVACFCIHLTCKWSNWEIPQSSEGKPWFWYIERSVTQEMLEQLTDEFLVIFEKCPSRLKKKIVSLSQSQNPMILSQFNSVKDDKKRNGEGSLGASGISASSLEEFKKKQDFQRHHPDYKKHHLSSHHQRPDGPNLSSKSSCMFGPPQRTQPSSHGNLVSSSHMNRSMPKSSSSNSNPPPDGVGGLGKPEHLHHRPRRPDDKHSSRNHELVPPPPYKKFDKVPSGLANEFPMPVSVNSRSGSSTSVNYSNASTAIASNSYQANALPHSNQMLAQQQIPPVHPQTTAYPEQAMKDAMLSSSMSGSMSGPVPKALASMAAAHRTRPPSPPLPPPAQVKIERSIFSPEKCTPPPEPYKSTVSPSPPVSVLPPNTHYMKPVPNIKEEYYAAKQEPPSTPYVDIKQEMTSPNDVKPPTNEAEIAAAATPTAQKPVPSQPVADEHVPHKEKKEKKKKKHKEKHKEHREHKDHKDKHKHKHKNRDPEPIVITIPKEKLTLPPAPEQSLKIKIARDKITTPLSPVESPSFKFKIMQGKIKESKKRDRSEERSSPGGLPAAKYHRPNGTTAVQVINHNQTHDNVIVDCSNIKQEVVHDDCSESPDYSNDNVDFPSTSSFLDDLDDRVVDSDDTAYATLPDISDCSFDTVQDGDIPRPDEPKGLISPIPEEPLGLIDLIPEKPKKLISPIRDRWKDSTPVTSYDDAQMPAFPRHDHSIPYQRPYSQNRNYGREESIFDRFSSNQGRYEGWKPRPSAHYRGYNRPPRYRYPNQTHPHMRGAPRHPRHLGPPHQMRMRGHPLQNRPRYPPMPQPCLNQEPTLHPYMTHHMMPHHLEFSTHYYLTPPPPHPITVVLPEYPPPLPEEPPPEVPKPPPPE